MAIDFEAEGLLKGLRGKQRDARRKLLEDLAADGVPLEELRRAVDEQRLALLPLERVLEPQGERYTPEEIAEEVGIAVELMRSQRQALGLPVPEPGQRVLNESDLDTARRLKGLIDLGIPEEVLIENARVMGQSMANVAAATTGTFGEALLQRGDTELDVGLRYAQAARELRPELMKTLEYALNGHQLELARQAAIGSAERASGHLEGAVEITACFADLVDFTKLGESLPPEEVGAMAGRLRQMADSVARSPVRVVKMIGDAAMLVSRESEPLLDAALDLVDAAEQEGEDFPLLRAGAAIGPALARGGDWYGRPVNLASRVTSIAIPGSVLVAIELRDAVDEDRYRWSPPIRKRLKGIDGAVELARVRRADDDR